MRYKIFPILLIIILNLSCKSTPEPPAWVMNTNNVYSSGIYITGRGQGSTRSEAENRAVTVISQYFQTEVNAQQETRTVFTTGSDGNTTTSRGTMEIISIQTQQQLRVVRFAEDPWRDPKTKKWEAVAYIRRDEGWAVHEPNARRQSDALLVIIESADMEVEPFNAFLRFGNAMAYADSSEYTGTLAFAYVLHPARARALYADADAATSTLLQKQLAARERSRVFVGSPVDYNNMIYQATVKALGNAGFSVEQNWNNALTYCLVQVEEGEQLTNDGVFYYPSLTGIISGRNGSLFSFKLEAPRQAAVTPDVAKRRAYIALSDTLEAAFSTELVRYQNALIKN